MNHNDNQSKVDKDALITEIVKHLHIEHGNAGHSSEAYGIWCLPSQGVVVQTCLKMKGDNVSTWKHRNPAIIDAINSLWVCMDKSWACMIIAVFSHSGEYLAEFLSEADIERDFNGYYDLQGQTNQFISVASGEFIHVE